MAITVDGATQTLPLAPMTTIGRHRSAIWPLCPPLFPTPPMEVSELWLEIRWFPKPERWAWTHLREVGRERIVTKPDEIPPEFTVWSKKAPIVGPRHTVSISLLDAGPPEPFAVDLQSYTIRSGVELAPLVEERGDGWWAPDGSAPLLDADVLLSEGRMWRFHPGTPSRRTVGMDLASPTVRIEFDPDARRLRVLDGARTGASVASRDVFVLVPYYRALLEGDGWLDPDAVARRVAKLIGETNQSFKLDRVNAMRSGLKLALHFQGVRNAHLLFETIPGRDAQSRLGIPAARVVMAGA